MKTFAQLYRIANTRILTTVLQSLCETRMGLVTDPQPRPSLMVPLDLLMFGNISIPKQNCRAINVEANPLILLSPHNILQYYMNLFLPAQGRSLWILL